MPGARDAVASAPDERLATGPGSEFSGVDLDVLRYSRVWEDHRLLDDGLALDGDSHVLSISSAGCNVLAMLLHEPAAITAVDLSPTEAALLELQLKAIAHLDAPSVRVLLGVAPARSDMRLGCYASLRPELTAGARRVWDARVDTIGDGLAWAGRLERYMHSFTRGPLVESVPDDHLRELFTLDAETDRQAWADRWLRTPEVEAAFRVFASRERMAADGRSPEQFAWVRDVDVAGGLWQRFQRVCTVLDTADNHYLRGFLLADLDGCWPDALTDEGQDRIRPIVDRVGIHIGDLGRVLETAPTGTYSHANLSDIFEYLSPEETTHVMNSFGARLRDRGRLAFWNLFVDRRPVDDHGAVRRLDELSDRLWLQDRSWFYGGFHVAEVAR